MGKFRIKYEVSDGFAGKARPHYFNITEDEIEEDMGEEELRQIFNESLQDHFKEYIQPYSEDENSFIEWAQEILNNRRIKNDNYRNDKDNK